MKNEFNAPVFQINQDARTTTASVKLSEDTKKSLKALAHWEGKTESEYILTAIEFYQSFQPHIKIYYPDLDPRHKMLRNRRELLDLCNDL